MADESNDKANTSSLSSDTSDDGVKKTQKAPSTSENKANTSSLSSDTSDDGVKKTQKSSSASENKANTSSLSSDTSDDGVKKTQKAPSTSEDNNNNTFNFDDTSSRKKRDKKSSATGDTAVFSKDDRRLKRILSSHQADENDGTMALGQKQEVILLIRGMVERIMMQSGLSYKLGRFEIGISEADEIDLTPYGAQDRGVSRLHAQLQIIDAIVHITDLGSTNGTFVNGKRLDSNTPIALRKGDELLLGRLAVQVLFRQ